MKKNALGIILMIAVFILASGCSDSNEKERSLFSKVYEIEMEYEDYVRSVSSLKFARSHMYIFEIKSDIDDEFEMKLKDLGSSISEVIKSHNSENMSAVFLYFYESGKNIPDLYELRKAKRLDQDMFDILYDGDHDGWAFQYIDSLGEPALVRCISDSSSLCKN